jgi:hypothetical protein
VVKLFFHISRKEQRRRLEKMERDPAVGWKVTSEDWRRNRRYDRWVEAVEDMLEKTHTGACPWTLVEATDARWTRVQVFRTIVERMDEALRRRARSPEAVSRTLAAREATRGDRERREKAGDQLMRSVAADAGMPLEKD